MNEHSDVKTSFRGMVLSCEQQKLVALNTMTIVYLSRNSKEWTEKFARLYSLAVFLSDVSRNEAELSSVHLGSFSRILEVDECLLVENHGGTSKRHAFWNNFLMKKGRI